MSDEAEIVSAALTLLALFCLLASFEVAHRRAAKAAEKSLRAWRSINVRRDQ